MATSVWEHPFAVVFLEAVQRGYRWDARWRKPAGPVLDRYRIAFDGTK